MRRRRFGRRALRASLWALVLAAAGLGVSLLIPGCSVGYVARQSATHLRVLAARQGVDEAITAGEIPPEWMEKIEVIRDAKRFGAESLGLPTGDLYETISLHPAGPTWIVTACPEDALEPVTWWFPVVGRVAYKGFYRREDAERLAAQLRNKGNDVLLYPSSAFSTLGWFSDPIRPSMLEGEATDLADLVLHEAAHRVLYWKGQTDFNESFATFVGEAGAIAWLEDREGAGCEACRAARAARADAPRFAGLIERTVQRLSVLYAEPISREKKLRRREEVFAWAREEHARIPWEGQAYAGFPRRRLDNAVILSYRRYGSGQEVFDRVLAHCGGNLGDAIRFVEALRWPDLPRRERREGSPLQLLRRGLEAGAACPPGGPGS